MIRIHVLTAMVCTSYLTLGIFDIPSARDTNVGITYALVALVLAGVGIFDGWRNHRA